MIVYIDNTKESTKKLSLARFYGTKSTYRNKLYFYTYKNQLENEIKKQYNSLRYHYTPRNISNLMDVYSTTNLVPYAF